MARILLVEDVPVVRRTLQRALTKAGHEVVVADTGDTGIAKLSEEEFDLLLSDVVMPGSIQGDQLAISAQSVHPTMPVILITGFTKMADRLEAMRNDKLRVLRKPIRRSELIECVSEMLL